MAVNITTDTNTVKVIAATTNNVKIVDNKNNTTVSVSQPTTRVIKVATIGPQGPGGTAFPYSGSAQIIGSLGITGSLSQGINTVASGSYSHAQGSGARALGYGSHAEGFNTLASGSWSHAEGLSTSALGENSHAEGFVTVASGPYQHVQGQYNISSSAQSAFIIGNGTSNNTRSNLVFASGSQFQVTGSVNINGSLTQGNNTSASGLYSHAEGRDSVASGFSSHTEGYNTQAQGDYSHAEGASTIASGLLAHSEGYGTIASGEGSHAEGYQTRATQLYQHAQGIYNATSTIQGAFMLGNGTDNSNRANLILAANNFVDISGSLHVRPNTTSSVNLLSANKQQTYEVVTTGQDTSFQGNYEGTVNPDRDIYTCKILSNGKVLIGGRFTIINNSTPARLAQVNVDGTDYATFNTNLGTGFLDTVYATLVQTSGKIVVGGIFTDFNTNTRNRLARVDSDGIEDTAFYTNLGSAFDGEVYALAANSNEDIFVGGGFTNFNSNGIAGLAKLDVDGNQNVGFNANLGSGFTGGAISAIEVQSDGKILVGGTFNALGNTTRYNLVRLNADGTVDTSFYSNYDTSGGVNGAVRSIKVQSDGNILVGGDFNEFNGIQRNRLIRLNSDGTEDTTFYTNIGTAFDAPVRSIQVQLDQKILVGGDFVNFNGTTRNYIVRLNSDGTENTAFYSLLGTAFDATVFSMSTDSSGNIAIGGAFTNYNTGKASYLTKLSSTINQAIKENVSINRAPDSNLINIQGRDDSYNIIDVVNASGSRVFTLDNSGSATFVGTNTITGSLLVTGSLTMSPSSSFILPRRAAASPQTGSAYWSGSFLFVYNGTRYMSASFF